MGGGRPIPAGSGAFPFHPRDQVSFLLNIATRRFSRNCLSPFCLLAFSPPSVLDVFTASTAARKRNERASDGDSRDDVRVVRDDVRVVRDDRDARDAREPTKYSIAAASGLHRAADPLSLG